MRHMLIVFEHETRCPRFTPTNYFIFCRTLAGELYSPDEDGGYRGYPEAVEISPHALDETLAQKLWSWAEQESGVRFI